MPIINNHDKCPDVAIHTDHPRGYLAWHEWARKMSKTHNNILCPTCKHWAIWELKTK